MRIYLGVMEMYEEVKRDLAEMGISVNPMTMQDKIVINQEARYGTKELQNYNYMILKPIPEQLEGVNREWADAEFEERIMDSKDFKNPGLAYYKREDIWDEYLHDGKFAYTYNERLHINNQLFKVINTLRTDNDTRQAWLSVWDPNIDPSRMLGISRVPCSLGYGFQIREGCLDIHYVMRSCDFITHFRNDVYLAMRLQRYVANELNLPVGKFIHTVFSLHVYNKDIEGVF